MMLIISRWNPFAQKLGPKRFEHFKTCKVNEKIDYLETELAKENDKNKKLRNDIHTKHEEIMKLKDNVDYWKNRPTRLAEMFNEIYDNVWTDTLEGLNQPKQIATEKKAVEHMASILKVCYEYCANKFQDTLTQVEEILLLNVEKNTDEELYKEECKQLKDMLKLAGVRTSKGLNQDMAIKSVHDPKLRKVMETYKDVTEKFTKQCLEICWLMAVQDPQVVLHWGSLKEGSSINSDHFKCFTRSGTLLEYVVWPAMLLHKDGPFLSKGIVQPLATTNTSTRFYKKVFYN
ncbi:hypothetical protein KUTeg_024278 [Tegillarca granosa]|uniref:Mitochondria-eating protein C-terminal domain-containing protein n=1 Tax=Tegillarca granosa TaxID=220873 RepID=A0ABQ9E2F5_TEGGR|nr:hypothetical protein KUTeg_024278 [Tegillarca granosa]